MPDDSYTPFFLGLFSALAFTGLLLHWAEFTVLMALACSLSLIVWIWPRTALVQRAPYIKQDTGAVHG
jgi:hypothetical protein